jgi:hypothetical protein
MTTEPIKPRVFRRTRGQLQPGLRPIVLEFVRVDESDDTEQDRERGEEYSEGLADIQQAEADLVRVARRATQAVAKGIDTYDQERRTSAQSKKDGAVEDFPHNSAKAMSAALKEASELPLDVADAITTKNYRKRLRHGLRRVSRSLRLYRL